MKNLFKDMGYEYDPENKIWVNPLFKGIKYSDGD